MTLDDAGLAEAFSRPVREAGLNVQPTYAAEPLTVRLRVVDPRRDNHLAAVFEAASNEYLGVRLDNGAHFWEHEWDEPFREAFAAQVGVVVVQHVAGAGTFEKGGSRYVVTVNGERFQTREAVDNPSKLEP